MNVKDRVNSKSFCELHLRAIRLTVYKLVVRVLLRKFVLKSWFENLERKFLVNKYLHQNFDAAI